MNKNKRKDRKIKFKRKNERKWVAYDAAGRVVHSSEDLKKLAKKMKENGYDVKDYTLEKVLPLDEIFIH